MGLKDLFSKKKKESNGDSSDYLTLRKAYLDEKADRDFFSLTEEEAKEYYSFHPELGYVTPVPRTEFNPWELDANYIPPGYEEQNKKVPDEPAAAPKNETPSISAAESTNTSADELRKLLERTDLPKEAMEALKKATDLLEQAEKAPVQQTNENPKGNDERLKDILKEVPDNCKTLTWFDRLGYKDDINTVLDEYWLKMSSIYKCNGKYYFNVFASTDGRSSLLHDINGYNFKYTICMNECKSLCLDVMWYLRVFMKTLGHLRHHVDGEKARERIEKEGPFSFTPEATGDFDLIEFCKKGKLNIICTVIGHGKDYPGKWKVGVMEEAEKHITDYFQTQADRIAMTGAKDEYYE